MRNISASNDGFAMSKSKKLKTHINPFEHQPNRLAVGDSNPVAICCAIGSTLTTWEMTEVAYSYLFNMIVRPRHSSPAIRRAYGSIVSPRGRREAIEAAAEVFFQKFPNAGLEHELSEFIGIHRNASARRNEIAHGVIVSAHAASWYLEANEYSDKRNVNRESPYAYTSTQITKIGSHYSSLRRDVEALRSTLKEHFQSSDPKARASY
jgi:hypothetical protein